MEETCQSNTLDWSSLVFIIIKQIFSNDFSVISQPILIKFGTLIVREKETCMC